MDSGYYAAMTGLVARTQALDTAAANLANAQTPGYRAEREYFRSVSAGPEGVDSQLGQAVNNYGLLGGDRLSMAQGPLQQTGNPLDLAIEGQGFLPIQTANGMRYTRDGSFHRSQDRRSLVTAANEPVLSSTASRSRFRQARFRWGDGVLSVGGGAVATVGVFSFPASVQNSRRKAPTAMPLADGVTPTQSQRCSRHQGAIEAANQDVVQGTLDLIVMQRQAEMMQKALTVFHTEFNKIATEDLPRV